jgi:uncharacterized membrane protein YraQ (UPF0718 family)
VYRIEEQNMAATASAQSLNVPIVGASTWRVRFLAILLVCGIAGFFWVDSRYPSLLKKYHSGTHVKVVGAITFDALYPVARSMPLGQRVWRTTINWLNANRIGMTFAFFFGPAVLTLLATFSRRRTKSRHLNALIGAVVGFPLAVCSNCVAPIGRGMYEAGMSTESVLAAMFSSPGLNIVVLAMTFALFPLKMALLKLATVFLLIFVFAPMIASRRTAKENEPVQCAIDAAPSQSWASALLETLRCYAKSFWTIFRVAFPLMILAAILGALVIELVPPQAVFAAPVSVLGIFAVALIAAFLPVPMGFDVVIAYIAMSQGLPMPYVAVILCTLGIFSVYSMAVVGKTISWKVATATYAAVAFLGIAAGIAMRVFA